VVQLAVSLRQPHSGTSFSISDSPIPASITSVDSPLCASITPSLFCYWQTSSPGKQLSNGCICVDCCDRDTFKRWRPWQTDRLLLAPSTLTVKSQQGSYQQPSAGLTFERRLDDGSVLHLVLLHSVDGIIIII